MRLPSLPTQPLWITEPRGRRPIRKYFAAIAVALVVASLLIGSAPVEARLRKVALGVSMPEGNGDVSTFNNVFGEFTRDVGGNKPATWTLWSQWGDRGGEFANCASGGCVYPKCEPGMGCAFPTAMAEAIRSKGATPFIWWEPITSRHKNYADSRQTEFGLGCPYSRFSRVVNGAHDAYIRDFARAAKRFGDPVLLRYTHEVNGKYFPWGREQCGNTISGFKKAWRRVYRLFREEGATNVKFVWTVATQSCRGGCNPYKAWYPGDRFVQYAGFSSFNWGAPKGWKPMVKGLTGVMSHFRKFTKRPVIVAELATARYGGPAGDPKDKAQWIKDGYPKVYKSLPGIKAIVYLNVDLSGIGHPDWSLNQPRPEAHQAYGWVASQNRFKGKFR